MKIASIFHVSTDYLLGIEKAPSIDLTGLTSDDMQLVHTLVETLRKKNLSLSEKKAEDTI